MANAAKQLARRGRTLAKQLAGTGYRLARAGAERALERAFGDGDAQRHRGPGASAPPRPARGPVPPSATQAVAAERAEPRAWRPADTQASPPDPALEHVTEEATLAGEYADVGAEQGAGPEVAVSPPWPGYDQMRARDVVDRLTGADAGLAAAVRLYESATKGRKTVLDAASRAERR